jgi:hypothetical protein
VIKQIKKKGYHYWTQWVKKRIRQGNPQILNSKNVYIVPSGFGWVYGVLVLSLLTGAINYQISMIFLLTFLLAIVGFVSAWEAHANIKDLSIRFISIEDAQQGKPAQLTLLIQAHQKIRFGLEFHIGSQSKIRVEKTPNQGGQIFLPIETSVRGYFSVPPIIISSQFPFGIFKVWSYARFDECYYVYPQPIDPGFWPTPIAHENYSDQLSLGQDEIFDLKQVENPWVEPNRIAWKIAAKGQGWYLKTMSSPKGDYWLFRLRDLPIGDLETKLQHMSYWLHTAQANGYVYDMELKNSSPHFAQGEEHLKELLRQLALY